MIYLRSFLEKLRADNLLNDFEKITDWKDFNRNNSHMKEYYDETPNLNMLRQYLHSKAMINWLEEKTGYTGLVVDSFGVGEGVSLMEPGDELDPHIDFNWNDRIKMHRSVNLLIYFGDCEGGEFFILDEDNNTLLFSEEPKHNSAIVFLHNETKPHGVRPVISGKRYAVRQFYYQSQDVCDDPHQSLYYFDDENKWYNPHKKMNTNTLYNKR